MSNKYLENKVKKFDLLIASVVFILIMASAIAGRYFYFNNLLSFVTGAVLGSIGAITVFLIEHFLNKQRFYEKGLKLEGQIAEKLEKFKIDYEPHVETPYGDLDLLVMKNGSCYGIEAKNWDGVVKFENGILKVSDWDSTHILTMLLKHCVLARNIKFGENSGKFIKPMLVFGYKTDVHIEKNIIMFNGVEVAVVTIRDFEKYL